MGRIGIHESIWDIVRHEYCDEGLTPKEILIKYADPALKREVGIAKFPTASTIANKINREKWKRGTKTKNPHVPQMNDPHRIIRTFFKMDEIEQSRGQIMSYNPEIPKRVLNWYRNYDVWYDSPVSVTDKNGNTKEWMERKWNGPPTVTKMCKDLGLNVMTINKWRSEHPILDAVIKEGQEYFKDAVIEGSLLGGYNGIFAKTVCEHMLDWVPTQKQTGKIEVSHSIDYGKLSQEDRKELAIKKAKLIGFTEVKQA